MLSAYDSIKREHVRLLDELARLKKLFDTIPQEKREADAAHSGAQTEAKSAEGKTSAPVNNPPASAPSGKGEPDTTTGEPVWAERPQIDESFKHFAEELTKHFNHEMNVVFPGIVMTMPTHVIILWTYARIYEHGVACSYVDLLKQMLSVVDSPLSRSRSREISRIFSQLDALLLAHAVEEDSKFDVLLKNNPRMATNIQLLANKYKSK